MMDLVSASVHMVTQTPVTMDDDEMLDTQSNSSEDIMEHVNSATENDKLIRNVNGEEPRIGMLFNSLLEAKLYYNDYAHKHGFSVKVKRTSKRKYDPTVIREALLVCSCEGEPSKTPKSRRLSKRCKCNAALFLKFNHAKYEVAKFIAEHTHELQHPARVHVLHSQRKIMKSQEGPQSDSSRDIMETMDNGIANDKRIQNVDDEEPKIGMLFDSVLQAKVYYNEYAKKHGFSVRVKRTSKSKYEPKVIREALLVCSCEGEYKMRRVPKKRRETRRFQCNAELCLKFNHGKYEVIRFTAEHTHELEHPDRVHLLRSHRKPMEGQAKLTVRKKAAGNRAPNTDPYFDRKNVYLVKGSGNKYIMLIEDVEKDLSQSTLVEFIHEQTDISTEAYVLPSLSSETYTRGIIVVDCKEKLEKLHAFVENPGHFIVSSRGRPWVILEKNLTPDTSGLSSSVMFNTQSRNPQGSTGDLRVVQSGSEEYVKAKKLRDLVTEFLDHHKRMHKMLSSEMKEVLEATPSKV